MNINNNLDENTFDENTFGSVKNSNILNFNLFCNPYYITYIISLFCIISACFFGGNLGSNIRKEQERLKELNLDNIQLQTIVDFTDEAGILTYQLNWKEILAILAVQKRNYTEDITGTDVLKTGALFINNTNKKVKTFDEVINSIPFKEKEKNRAYDYLDDLKYFGFTPDRLKPDSEQMKFIELIKDSAIENYKESNILPSITIAQAILESNWGKSSLTKEANNLFGIKADSSWKGESMVFDTNEYYNQMIKDKFRKYDSLYESMKDHSAFLTKHKRYTEAGVFTAKTYKEQALALENAGYSTAEDEHGNKTYAKMLGELIRQYNLQLIDAEIINQ